MSAALLTRTEAGAKAGGTYLEFPIEVPQSGIERGILLSHSQVGESGAPSTVRTGRIGEDGARKSSLQRALTSEAEAGKQREVSLVDAPSDDGLVALIDLLRQTDSRNVTATTSPAHGTAAQRRH